MTTLNNVTKTSGRHFYAVKTDSNGNDIPYAFNNVAARNEWLQRNDKSKPITADEVYQMLNKQDNEALIANRRNRVIKLAIGAEIYPEKGQRLIRQ